MKNLIVLFFVTIALPGISQVNSDSLRSVWHDQNLSDSVRLNALFSLSNYWSGLSPDSAEQCLYKGLRFCELHSNNEWSVAFTGRLCELFMKQGKLDTALLIINTAIRFSDSIDFKEGRMRNTMVLAGIYQQQGRNQEAMDLFTNAYAIALEDNDWKTQAKILNNMGITHFHWGDFDKASEYWHKSLKISEEHGLKELMGHGYFNMGNIYSRQGEMEKALEYYETSLGLYGELGDRRLIASSLNKIGQILLNSDEEKAIEYLERSLKISHELNDFVAISGNLIALASYYDWRKQDHKKALYYDNQSLDAALKSGDQRVIAHAMMGICVTYYLMKDWKKSIEIGLKSKKLCIESGSGIDLKTTSEVLYECYQAIGDYKNALENYKQFVSLRDSINGEKNNREVLRQEYQYEYEKQKITDSLNHAQEAMQADLEYQRTLNQKNQTRNILVGSVIIVLLLAGGGWSRARFIKKANQRLAYEKERAEKSEAFKQEFLANMSHEIRTPMNAVLGMTNLTLDTKLTKKKRDYLEAVRKSSENLLFIINDILDLSKLEAGGMVLDPRPFKLASLISQVQQILQFKAEEKGLSFDVSIDSKIPEFVVGDDLRLNQVLINLCGNAVKFTDKGSVELNVSQEGGQVKFVVSDTGIGIESSKINELFTSFKQVDTGTTRRYGGTGLGLSISRSLVQLMGGVIEVNSVPGKGSEFSFTLDLKMASEHDIASLQEKEKLDLGLLKGIRILLAEDNKYNVIVVNDTLINLVEDVRIDVAENGKVAVEMVKQNQYDLVLMDSDMPLMDGREATKIIRQLNSEKKDIPIIALTSSVLATEIGRCLDAGMNDSIPKPFDREEFFNTISKYYINKDRT